MLETVQFTVTFDPSQVDTGLIRTKLAQAGFEAEPDGGSA